ncbi:hypothetical protein HPB52_021854 [Rhipicephalus sanguineus]|uniref:Uncharacterized protein n=1 Tax=Rhipicephalus sanguineus TaxID=34632 RepID=A0A9D4SR07_RHISA|nr:hypothetical protein HPB52_021854 [Rhipicephalus sanguineus]
MDTLAGATTQEKGLLPFDSAHSKTIKRAIALMCLESALEKSCPHQMMPSFENQLVRTVLLVGRVEILAGAYVGDVGRNFVAQASKRLQRTSEEQQLEPEGEKVELDRLPDP